MAARLTPAQKLAQLEEQKAKMEATAKARFTRAQDEHTKATVALDKAQDRVDSAKAGIDAALEELTALGITPEEQS